jgi:5-methylcytosine-specific restriction endonuclease McrA
VEIASAVILRRQKLRCYNGIMTNESRSLTALSDSQLLAEVGTLAARERHATVRLIAALAELDARRLYLGEGYSSLFTYCTHVLHLSEHAAYARIEAARAARRWPSVLAGLEDGSLTLTNVCLLARHLTPSNHQALLGAARHKSKREVEHQIATLHPLPPVETTIRELPTATGSASTPFSPMLITMPVDAAETSVAPQRPMVPSPAPVRTVVLQPIAPERYKLQLTISRETHDKLRQVQDLMRHINPLGDPAVILDRALTLLLAELRAKRCGHANRPRTARSVTATSRYIPAAVRREVWTRDDGRCAFLGTQGRCLERGQLEFHHLVPFADGGPTSTENLQLRCRAHNAHEAREYFADIEPIALSLFA